MMKKTMRILMLVMMIVLVVSVPLQSFAAELPEKELTKVSSPSVEEVTTVASTKSGLYKVEGQWKYFEKGKFKAVTGLVQRADTGTWHYAVKGIYNKATGLVKCVQPGVSQDKWFYVKNGDLSKETGLVQCIQPGVSKGKWFYVVNGKLKKDTGLVKCIQPGGSNGNYYYVVKGKLNKSTGLVKCIQPGISKGKWYYVKNGKLKKATGLVKRNDTGTYHYVDGGKYTRTTTVTAEIGSKSGKQFYVKKGDFDSSVYNGIDINGVSYVVRAGVANKAVSKSDLTLYRATKLLNQITTPDMSRAEKLKAAFNHIRDNYKEYNPRIPHSTAVDWPIIYANDIFVDNGGNCLSCAAAMAYLAKAIGYKEVYACNSGGHGWAEVNGLIYDPEWARHNFDSTYFALNYNGNTGNQNYKGAIGAGLPYMRVKI